MPMPMPMPMPLTEGLSAEQHATFASQQVFLKTLAFQALGVVELLGAPWPLRA